MSPPHSTNPNLQWVQVTVWSDSGNNREGWASSHHGDSWTALCRTSPNVATAFASIHLHLRHFCFCRDDDGGSFRQCAGEDKDECHRNLLSLRPQLLTCGGGCRRGSQKKERLNATVTSGGSAKNDRGGGQHDNPHQIEAAEDCCLWCCCIQGGNRG